MKLLGWMHRKFRQNSGDVFKDFASGPTLNCLSGGQSLDDHHQQLSPVLPARAHGLTMRGRHVSSAAAVDETFLFDGLLSIGTLGSGPIEEEPEAEYIQESVEAIAEKGEAEAATETDLLLVNSELEKVLGEAAEREGGRLSSARPSKSNEACPLQEYLFGSAVDGVLEKERKEKRTSLGELFMIEEAAGGEETAKAKGEGKGVNAIMKKMLLKKNGSHRNSKRAVAAAAAGGAPPPPTATAKEATGKTKKFQKILQILNKKIHPENDVASRKPTKYSKHKSKHATSCIGSNCFVGSGDNMLMASSERTYGKGKKGSFDQPSLSLEENDSTSSLGHWIKTDADYLVLEL